jgi:hypothetical protein
MNTRTTGRLHSFAGVWIAAVGLILLTVMLLFSLGGGETAEAAILVTLKGGEKLNVLPNACSLDVLSATSSKVRVTCIAYTATATNTPTATATATSTSTTQPQLGNAAGDWQEVANAPSLKRTLAAGKVLKVLANGCKLQVKQDTPQKVVVFCKAAPTPTRTKSPAKATLVIRNLSGGEACIEVFGTGIGQKCFGGGDSLYGSFPAGTYSYGGSLPCGNFSSSFNFTPTTWRLTLGCRNGRVEHFTE